MKKLFIIALVAGLAGLGYYYWDGLPAKQKRSLENKVKSNINKVTNGTLKVGDKAINALAGE